jgi:anti-sigma regulatory factor (Ser/Thr protein kinase)
VRRARAVRADADALRSRTALIREQADLVLDRLLDSLRRLDARPLGDRGSGAFFLRLVRYPQAISFARQDLRRWLERYGVSAEEALDVALACSEACANAIEHAGRSRRPTIEIEATRKDGTLELAVRDYGRWSVPADGSTRGRGLKMMQAIMDEVEVIPSADGTQVVMRRSLGGEHG